MDGEVPGRAVGDAPDPSGEAGLDWPPHMGLWLALIPVRATAMVACGAVLTPGVNWVEEMVLPRVVTGVTWVERLGLVLITSAVLGAALGAVLTQPLGRGKLHPEARWWGALMAVVLLVVVGLVVLTA